MMIAGVTHLGFEPKMNAVLDATGTTQTPENLRPKMGPLANISYKPAELKYLMRLSAAPTAGTVVVKAMAGETAVKTESVNINGVTEISNSWAVDLSQVAGETPLSLAVEVTETADAGITATIDGYLQIEQPLTITGC